MDDAMNKAEVRDDGTRQRLSDEAAKRRIEASDAKNELAAAQAELNATRLTLARLTAQREHPQITDEMFEKLCGASTPEAVAEWAESFAGLVSKQDAPEAVGEQEKHDESEPESYVVRQRFLAGIQANKVGGGKLKGAVESEEDGREIARKLNEKRIARAHGRVSSGDK